MGDTVRNARRPVRMSASATTVYAFGSFGWGCCLPPSLLCCLAVSFKLLHALTQLRFPSFSMSVIFNARSYVTQSLVAASWRRLSSSNVSSRFPPPLLKLETSEENAQARDWIVKFKTSRIPKDDVQLTYSRSSGPGGQVRPSSSCLNVSERFS